jgi:hypothetical protein
LAIAYRSISGPARRWLPVLTLLLTAEDEAAKLLLGQSIIRPSCRGLPLEDTSAINIPSFP